MTVYSGHIQSGSGLAFVKTAINVIWSTAKAMRWKRCWAALVKKALLQVLRQDAECLSLSCVEGLVPANITKGTVRFGWGETCDSKLL